MGQLGRAIWDGYWDGFFVAKPNRPTNWPSLALTGIHRQTIGTVGTIGTVPENRDTRMPRIILGPLSGVGVDKLPSHSQTSLQLTLAELDLEELVFIPQ